MFLSVCYKTRPCLVCWGFTRWKQHALKRGELLWGPKVLGGFHLKKDCRVCLIQPLQCRPLCWGVVMTSLGLFLAFCSIKQTPRSASVPSPQSFPASAISPKRPPHDRILSIKHYHINTPQLHSSKTSPHGNQHTDSRASQARRTQSEPDCETLLSRSPGWCARFFTGRGCFNCMKGSERMTHAAESNQRN